MSLFFSIYCNSMIQKISRPLFYTLVLLIGSQSMLGCFSKKKVRSTDEPKYSSNSLMAPNGQPVSIPPGKNLQPQQKNPSKSPQETSAQQTVTQKWGPLKLIEGQMRWKADQPAWSSWWYPLKDRELTQAGSGHSSTLQKYDQLLSRMTQQPVQATQLQNQFYQSLDQPPWAGLCDARAFAASLHSEPQQSALIHGICWTPKDLKALLILSYSQTDPDKWNGVWGQPNSEAKPSSARNDIFPHDFIKLLMMELGQKKKVLLFDSDLDQEVWTEVANSAELTVSKTSSPDQLMGQLVIHTPSYKLTLEEKQQEMTQGIGNIEVPFIYNISFRGKWHHDQFVVESSEWIKSSASSHPDFAIQLPENLKDLHRESNNPYVTSDWVDHILSLAQKAPPCR